MVQYSDTDLYRFIRAKLFPQFLKWSDIQRKFEFDDLVQEAILWWYQPMKSGEQRFTHYKRTCTSAKHLESIIYLSICEFIPGLYRLNSVKIRELSLDVPLKDEPTSRLIDLIPDEEAHIPSNMINSASLLSHLTPLERQIVKELSITGYEEERHRLLSENKSLNYINRKLKDIDPHGKYTDYENKLSIIKNKIKDYYSNLGEELSSERSL